MPFHLSRGGANVPAEVQRWQYFLRRKNIAQTGLIDGVFGIKTEEATRILQVKAGLVATGALDKPTLDAVAQQGYTVLPDDYYKKRASPDWPAKPSGLESPSNEARNANFGCFAFMQHPRPPRPDKEAVVIGGNCEGTVPDWTAANIVDLDVPQMRFVSGSSGRLRCHKVAGPIFKALFARWEQDDLLHLLMSYSGAFDPRYKRKQAPHPTNGHGWKKSSQTPALSNHAFGSAFDVNVPDNQQGEQPALCGERGSVRELVASANALGVYWGGHFSYVDGMHFEVSEIGAGAAVEQVEKAFARTLSAVTWSDGAAPKPKPDPAITWFKTTFGQQIATAIAGTPLSTNLLAAVAMQETSYLWRKLYPTMPVADLLAICVGDTIDAPSRSAFPKTRAELEAATDGRAMFALARAALLEIAKYNADYAKAAKNPNKFCRGYGMFQRDLQFFNVDPDYFLKEKWKSFDATLAHCVDLLSKQAKRYFPKSATLSHDESVYTAIAYNKGSVDLKKGFKQGYKDPQGIYYGEHIDRFLSAAEIS